MHLAGGMDERFCAEPPRGAEMTRYGTHPHGFSYGDSPSVTLGVSALSRTLIHPVILNFLQVSTPVGVFFVMLEVCLKLFSFTT